MKFKPYIPKKENGDEFLIKDLFPDQKAIACQVLAKTHEWIHCTDYSTFEPLRCTINGQGGTGKSVLLNTLASVVRKLTNLHESVMMAAPTGTAAFNVNGETIHSMVGLSCHDEDMDYVSMGCTKKNRLVEKFKNCLLLVFDERSMLTSHVLGKSEKIISSVVYEGRGLKNHTWGGIPVVLIAGEDDQLGGVGEGATDSLPPHAKASASSLVIHGRNLFHELGKTAFKLPKIRRVDKSKLKDMALLERIRIGENVKDADVERCQRLHLTEIQLRHGKPVVDEIMKNAIHLFFTNEKRCQHNLLHLSRTNSKDNPTALVKTTSTSSKQPKGIRSHFKHWARKEDGEVGSGK